jgi:hypothetical protein
MESLRLVFAFFSVFGLLGLLYYFSRRWKTTRSFRSATIGLRLSELLGSKTPGQTDSLKVHRRLHLTATHQLHLVVSDDQKLLICTYPQGCTLVQVSEVDSRLGHQDHAA